MMMSSSSQSFAANGTPARTLRFVTSVLLAYFSASLQAPALSLRLFDEKSLYLYLAKGRLLLGVCCELLLFAALPLSVAVALLITAQFCRLLQLTVAMKEQEAAAGASEDHAAPAGTVESRLELRTGKYHFLCTYGAAAVSLTVCCDYCLGGGAGSSSAPRLPHGGGHGQEHDSSTDFTRVQKIVSLLFAVVSIAFGRYCQWFYDEAAGAGSLISQHETVFVTKCRLAFLPFFYAVPLLIAAKGVWLSLAVDGAALGGPHGDLVGQTLDLLSSARAAARFTPAEDPTEEAAGGPPLLGSEHLLKKDVMFAAGFVLLFLAARETQQKSVSDAIVVLGGPFYSLFYGTGVMFFSLLLSLSVFAKQELAAFSGLSAHKPRPEYPDELDVVPESSGSFATKVFLPAFAVIVVFLIPVTIANAEPNVGGGGADAASLSRASRPPGGHDSRLRYELPTASNAVPGPSWSRLGSKSRQDVGGGMSSTSTTATSSARGTAADLIGRELSGTNASDTVQSGSMELLQSSQEKVLEVNDEFDLIGLQTPMKLEFDGDEPSDTEKLPQEKSPDVVGRNPLGE